MSEPGRMRGPCRRGHQIVASMSLIHREIHKSAAGARDIRRYGWIATARFTFQHTGPTSAYPGHYSWPWLLRASFSPPACGWHLLREMTSLTEGWWGLLRSQFSWFVSVGRCSPPGLCGSACRSVDSAAGALSCAVLAPAHQPLPLGKSDDGFTTPLLALPIDAC